jgi:IS5 family transposase
MYGVPRFNGVPRFTDLEVLDRVEETTGVKVERVTADSAYAHPRNYEALEERGTEAVIPPQRQGRRKVFLPQSRFKYDSKHKVVRCPAGRKMQRRSRVKNGWVYRAERSDCAVCPLREVCVPRTAKVRTILIVDGYPSLLRARRKRAFWDDETFALYNRHRWRVEGVHGEGKTQHGLRRAVRRGLENVSIQAFLTATVINLKRLAAFVLLYFSLIKRSFSRVKPFTSIFRMFGCFSVESRKSTTFLSGVYLKC